MEYTTNAPYGAAFLTFVMPGWEDRVDLSTLDMTNMSNCVLAQACNMLYDDALRFLFPEMNPVYHNEVAARFGFDLPTCDRSYILMERRAAWDRLRTEWVQIITDLRSQDLADITRRIDGQMGESD